MDSAIFIISSSFVFSFFEGVREYLVYEIDRAGKFPKRDFANYRKSVNAFLYCLVFICYLIYFVPLSLSMLVMFLCVLFMRWTFLDGTMNVFRDKNFFYSGTVSKIDKMVRKFEAWIISLNKKWKINIPPLTPYIKVIGLATTIFFSIWLNA
jgi:hypothetical protein